MNAFGRALLSVSLVCAISASAGADGLEELVVIVPSAVIAGIAEISLVRIDRVLGFDECTGQFTQVEKAYASNAFKLGASASYVVSTAGDKLAVMTQGDPFAANPETTMNLVAQIPIGGNPRDTALTADKTRAAASTL